MPGAIPAGFSVGTQGDASYTIPITVPAGTGGLKPNLALSYNHLAGNGLAGMRWTLSGISSIARCSQTFAQDGVSTGALDRYCFNGQRLVNVSSAYDAGGTEYRTEIESFQRIKQQGTGASTSFYVDHGNGLRSYFGETSNSRAPASGTARTWYITRTIDQFGNEIEYSYSHPTANETLPLSIVWTDNDAQSLSPRYAVTITYEDRPTGDQRFGYDSLGGVWWRTKRIDEIAVTYDPGTGAQSIATYALTYDSTAPPNGTGRSRLTAVSVCRGYWRIHRSTGTTIEASYSASVSGADVTTTAFMADIAGIGLPQIVSAYSSAWHVHPRSGGLADVVTDFTDGLGRTISVDYASLAQTTAYTLDLDHDPAQSYVRRYGGARYVVTTETHDDGIGGTRAITHAYDTAFVNIAGRGWQSFRKHTVTDAVQGTKSVTEYSQAFPTAGIPVSAELRTVSGDKLIRSVTSTLPTPAEMELTGSTTPPRQFPRIEQTTTVEQEVFGPNDGETLRTIVEDPAYDTTYGYVTNTTRTVTQPGVSGAWVTATDFDRGVIDGTGQWCLGLPGTVVTSNELPGGSPVSRTVDTVYTAKCRPDTVTDLSEAGDTTKQLVRELEYDAFGNVLSVSE